MNALSQCNFILLHLVPIKNPCFVHQDNNYKQVMKVLQAQHPSVKVSFMRHSCGGNLGHFGKIPHPLTHGPSTPPENCPTILIFKIETVHTKV